MEEGLFSRAEDEEKWREMEERRELGESELVEVEVKDEDLRVARVRLTVGGPG